MFEVILRNSPRIIIILIAPLLISARGKYTPRITMRKNLTRTREKYSLFSLSPRAEIRRGAIRIIMLLLHVHHHRGVVSECANIAARGRRPTPPDSLTVLTNVTSPNSASIGIILRVPWYEYNHG